MKKNFPTNAEFLEEIAKQERVEERVEDLEQQLDRAEQRIEELEEKLRATELQLEGATNALNGSIGVLVETLFGGDQ